MKKIGLLAILLLANIVLAQTNKKENDVDNSKIKDSLELISYKKETNHFNIRKERKFGVNTVIGGESIILSVSLDYFVTPTLNIGIGFGIIGFYAGAKYHFRGDIDNLKWSPYVGVSGVALGALNGNSTAELYLPLGIQYIGNKGFSISIEAAALSFNSYDVFPVWGAIKVGYRFKHKH